MGSDNGVNTNHFVEFGENKSKELEQDRAIMVLGYKRLGHNVKFDILFDNRISKKLTRQDCEKYLENNKQMMIESNDSKLVNNNGALSCTETDLVSRIGMSINEADSIASPLSFCLNYNRQQNVNRDFDRLCRAYEMSLILHDQSKLNRRALSRNLMKISNVSNMNCKGRVDYELIKGALKTNDCISNMIKQADETTWMGICYYFNLNREFVRSAADLIEEYRVYEGRITVGIDNEKNRWRKRELKLYVDNCEKSMNLFYCINVTIYALAAEYLLMNHNSNVEYPNDLLAMLIECDIFDIEYIKIQISVLGWRAARIAPGLAKKFEVILQRSAHRYQLQQQKIMPMTFGDLTHLGQAMKLTYALVFDDEKSMIDDEMSNCFQRKREIALATMNQPEYIQNLIQVTESKEKGNMKQNEWFKMLYYANESNRKGETPSNSIKEASSYSLGIDYLWRDSVECDEYEVLPVLLGHGVFNISFIKDQLNNVKSFDLLSKMQMWKKFKMVLRFGLGFELNQLAKRRFPQDHLGKSYLIWMHFNRQDEKWDGYEEWIKKKLVNDMPSIKFTFSYWVGMDRERLVLNAAISNRDLEILENKYHKNIVPRRDGRFQLPYLRLKSIGDHDMFSKMLHNTENRLNPNGNCSLQEIVEWIQQGNKDNKRKSKIILTQKSIVDIKFRLIDVANSVTKSEFYEKYHNKNIFELLDPNTQCLFLSDFNIDSRFCSECKIDTNNDCIKMMKEFDIYPKITALQKFALAKQVIDEFDTWHKNRKFKNNSEYFKHFWKSITYDQRIRSKYLRECQILSYCNVFQMNKNVCKCAVGSDARRQPGPLYTPLNYEYNKKIKQIDNHMVWGIYSCKSRWDKIVASKNCDRLFKQMCMSTQDINTFGINTLECYCVDDSTGKIKSNYVFVSELKSGGLTKDMRSKIEKYSNPKNKNDYAAMGLYLPNWEKVSFRLSR